MAVAWESERTKMAIKIFPARMKCSSQWCHSTRRSSWERKRFFNKQLEQSKVICINLSIYISLMRRFQADNRQLSELHMIRNDSHKSILNCVVTGEIYRDRADLHATEAPSSSLARLLHVLANKYFNLKEFLSLLSLWSWFNLCLFGARWCFK